MPECFSPDAPESNLSCAKRWGEIKKKNRRTTAPLSQLFSTSGNATDKCLHCLFIYNNTLFFYRELTPVKNVTLKGIVSTTSYI